MDSYMYFMRQILMAPEICFKNLAASRNIDFIILNLTN